MRHESSHPPHIKKNLPYSEFLRIRRICTKLEDYIKSGQEFIQYFVKRGYPAEAVTQAFNTAWGCSRESLLTPKVKTPEELNKNKGKLFAITVYHPTQKDFMDTILENWDILGTPVPDSSMRPKTNLSLEQGALTRILETI